MGDVYTIRNMDEKTRKEIQDYAHEHDVSIAEALRELIMIATKSIKKEESKKYKSIFDVYNKIKFSAEPDLSKKIDKVLYG